MSIIGRLLRPFIMKEMRNLMKDFIQPILDLIKTLVQPSQGTKFLITLAGFGLIYYLEKSGLGDDATIITVGSMVAVYYVADIFHKTRKAE